MPKHHSFRSVFCLTALQVVAMALPLLSMPILARSLGVVVFGQVMWALGLSLLAAVWVDAGLNGESQRQMAVSDGPAQEAHILWCNLGARTLLAVPAVVLVLLVGAWGQFVPLGLLCFGLLQVLGTLLFVQWWWLARAQGVTLGLLALGGRALSVLAIWLGVQSPEDAAWAVVCMASGTVMSGLAGAQAWLPLLWRQRKTLRWTDPVVFLKSMRFAFMPSFAAAMAHNMPVLILGWVAPRVGHAAWVGQQVAWYAAADRLAKAAAHVSHSATQTLLSMAARPDRARLRLAIMLGGCVLLCALGVVLWLAPWLIALLYGVDFLPTVPLFQWLMVWWGLYVVRQACQAVFWGSQGDWSTVARLQWQEAIVLLVLTSSLAWLQGAQGVAWAIVINEWGLLFRIVLLRRIAKTDSACHR